MRPLSRTPNGNNYKTYQSYRSDLLQRYGPYCAYCEKKDNDLDIEHVETKSKSGKITDWNNLLLACPTCNRDFKKAFNASRMGYVFPDKDETFKVFHYRANGTIAALTQAAVKTKKLCGLDRSGATSNRADAYSRAFELKQKVISGTRKPVDVLPWAQSMGHWSVWVSIFHDVPSVLVLLFDPASFPGNRVSFLHPTKPPLVR